MLLTHQIEKREQVTAEHYNSLLGALPPAIMVSNGFLVGEPMDHDSETGHPRYEMYMEEEDNYYYVGRATRADFELMLKPDSQILK